MQKNSKIKSVVFLIMLLWLMTICSSSAHTGFLMKYKCPICGTNFEATQTMSMTVMGTLKDFAKEGAIGSYYADMVVCCPSCHYATYADNFQETVSDDVKDFVLKNLKTQMPGQKPDDAEECDFAAQLLIWKKEKNEKIAYQYLVASYLLREAPQKDQERRKEMQKKAIEYLTKSLEAGEMENKGPVTYLIGDLYRRTGDFEKAVTWYDKALLEKDNPDWVTKMIEEQKKMAEKKDDNNNI